jgi:phosphatidylglycerol:prolipoprotein diacylglycerol transferase
MQPYLELFGREVPSYSLMLLVGYLAGFFAAFARRRLYPLERIDIFVAYVLAGFGALVGGKLFGVIQGFPLFVQLHASAGLSFFDYAVQTGMVYYGGFIGCVLLIGLFSVLYKIPYWDILDTLLPSLPLAQAFGRIGCFLVGCCYGVPYEHGIVMNASPFISHNDPLLPVQLIESASVAGLFLLMMLFGKKARPPGKLLGVYMTGYAVIRFILEFFRGDLIRGVYGVLSTSQWVSIAVFAVSLFLLLAYKKKGPSRYSYKITLPVS